MSLWDRLVQADATGPKIPVHQFMAAMGEWERGLMTRAEVITAFGLLAAEEADLDNLKAKFFPLPELYVLPGGLTLTNIGTAYDSIPATKSLGYVRLETFGITELEINLRYNQQSAGQIDFQLWNETDAVSIGVSSTTGVGDNKNPIGTFTPATSPMPAGLKILRVRCKSAVAADDAFYYGGNIRLIRDGQMQASVLHEVLLMAEKFVRGGIAPLASIAALKARLGVA
jgi:hypothetical protein